MELVIEWARGWAVSRGAPPPVAVPGGVRIDVGPAPRFILSAWEEDGLARLGRELTRPGSVIKILGPAGVLRAALPPAWTMFPRCAFMTSALSPAGAAGPARITAEGDVLVASVLDGEGGVAASARLAGHGRYGIFDQVETRSDRRRQGLGTALMTALGARAAEAGRTTGLLSATDDGRALYERLGWSDLGEVAGAHRS